MAEFTHFNTHGDAIMVDVSEKKDTLREATARGRILMNKECFQKVRDGQMKKGDVRDEFSNGGKFKFNDAVFGTFYFLLKYVAPVGMVMIFVTNFIGS